MALVGIELEAIVSEPDALTTRPPPCANQLSVFALPTLNCNLIQNGISVLVKHATIANFENYEI